MEVDQPTSKFQKGKITQIVSCSEHFASQKRQIEETISFSRLGKLNDFFAKIVAEVYQKADSISGNPSYFLLDSFSDYDYPSLFKIINLLEKNKLIDIEHCRFSNTRYNDAPFFYRVVLTNRDCSEDAIDGFSFNQTTGHAQENNAKECLSKAIGEFLERHFLGFCNKKIFLKESLGSIRKSIINLDLLNGFSDEQKVINPRRQFNEKSVFYWEKIKRVSNEEEVYVPAQFIYWRYILDESEPMLCEFNTNGAGGYFSEEGAILSALYELIQRDSFLIYWVNSLPPKKINPKTILHDKFQNLLCESERYGFEVYCLDITTDIGVPAFAVIISDKSGMSPRFSLGAGCQSDPAEALYHALKEAWAVYYALREAPLYPVLKKNYQPFKENIGRWDRLRLWANPEMAEYFNPFISGEEKSFSDIKFNYPTNFSSTKDELVFLVKKIESLGPGYEVYYYLVKNPLLSEIGYCCAKVIVPNLIPMYLNEPNVPLGKSRLNEAPKKLGFQPNLNPLPHPFP